MLSSKTLLAFTSDQILLDHGETRLLFIFICEFASFLLSLVLSSITHFTQIPLSKMVQHVTVKLDGQILAQAEASKTQSVEGNLWVDFLALLVPLSRETKSKSVIRVLL